MLGAIIGDISGSRFEFNNNRSKDFELLTYRCSVTDDSIMSLAVAKSILDCNENYESLNKVTIENMQNIGRKYPNCGYGGDFYQWIFSDDPRPYNSFGNGAAMRISSVGFAANSIEEAKMMAKKVTEISHNHPESIKAAETVASAIFMAKEGHSMLEIRDYIGNYYDLNFTLDEIRDNYQFDVSCQGSVPQAFAAFFESTDFEDAIRNAISIGGDSDTIAAITGGIAEAYYGIPSEIRKHALTFLDEELLEILLKFENKYLPTMENKNKNSNVGVKRKEVRKTKIGGREEMLESSNETVELEKKDANSDNKETTSTQLFNHLYEACNILRGPINQDEYKSYVTPILFFKRISDVYDEETQDALERSCGDEEYATFAENHSFVIPEGCHWQDVRKKGSDVGKAIVDAMNGIERANPDTLNGVFTSFDDATWTDKTKLNDERLKDLVEHMSKIKVGNKNYSADVMGDAYEYLIKKFADLSKKNAGEFYTPRAVVKLLVKILEPKAGDTVYDCACGTGGMLIEAIKHINNDVKTYGKIYGQEKNLSTSAIARMNLFLHGARDFKIVKGDTLLSPAFIERGKLKTFNCVIANPPFSLKNWGAGAFASDPYGRNIWGTPSDSSADFAWLQHMVASMDKKDGRCAVILPQGVLFHTGNEGEMRKQLIESDKIEAIITFVGGIFYSTGVSACAIILNNNKPEEHKNKICMIDGSKIYTAKRAQNILEEKDINKIYNLYKKYEDVIEEEKIVTLDDIASHDYVLSVNSYIEKKQVDTISPEIVKQEFIALYERVKDSEERLTRLLREGGYIDE